MTLSKTYRDFLERLVWTALSAGLAALASVGFGADGAEAALNAALTAAINAALIFSRQRLAFLPDPGDGLPKLPVA